MQEAYLNMNAVTVPAAPALSFSARMTGAGLALLAIGVVSHTGGFDLWLSSKIYTANGGFLRDVPFLRDVLHKGMHQAVITAFCVIGAVLAYAAFRRPDWTWQKPMRVFMLCAGIYIGLVVGLKSQTTFACPWSLTQFGGDKTLVTSYADLFDTAQYGRGRCFPAGHSSSGYAWLGLAFVLAAAGTRRFWKIFAACLTVGLVFSTAQILRGAHFLSHELTTAGLALIVFAWLPQWVAAYVPGCALWPAPNGKE